MASQIPVILDLSTIQRCLKKLKKADLIAQTEQGFVAYSAGQTVVPPVGELLFEKPRGEVHIKYGYINRQNSFIVKIASGFYENPGLGIRSSQGLMLLFSQLTGVLQAILLDEGHLTDMRTAVASMITLKYLAPAQVNCIGIIGTGLQAHLQLAFLEQVTPCKQIVVWGRNPKKALDFQKNPQHSNFTIKVARTPSDLAKACNVIITTTAATSPVLEKTHIQAGTHITAIGADTAEKTELCPSICYIADRVVADSIAQSHTRGEVFQARKSKLINEKKLLELGKLIQNPKLGRENDRQITVADLTGIAVQDIVIATSVFDLYKKINP